MIKQIKKELKYNMENQEKELDLLDLFRLLTDWFKKIMGCLFKGMLSFIRFNIKNWIVVLCLLMLGIAASIFKFQNEHRKHSAEFLLEIRGTSNFVVKDVLEALFDLIDSDDKEKKQKVIEDFGLSENEIKKIYDAGVFYAIDLHSNGSIDFIDYSNSFKEDSVNVKVSNILSVQVRTRGKIDYEKFQEKIICYLNNNSNLSKGKTLWMENIMNMISALDVEIVTLDSLRNAQIKNTQTGIMTAGLGKDNILVQTTSYYQDMIGLKARKMDFEKELTTSQSAVLPYTIIRVKNVDTNGFILFKWTGFFYVMGLFVTLIIRKRKEIINFVKKQKNS